MRLSSWVDNPSSSCPRNFTDPEARPFSASSPIIAIAVWVLPEPDSPTIPSVWPGSRSKLSPLTACTTPSGVSNATVRSLTSSSAMRRCYTSRRCRRRGSCSQLEGPQARHRARDDSLTKVVGARPEVADERCHHQPVEHRDSRQRNEPNGRGDRKRHADTYDRGAQ